MDKSKDTKIVTAVIILFISLTIFSNLGSLRALSIATLAVDGGALLYPLTFTCRDILHKKAGASLTRFTIWMSAVVNALLFLFLWLVGILPADSTVGPQLEYAMVLAPGVRLVVASVIALLISELLDTHIYSLVRRRLGSRRMYLRTLISNGISVPVDTVLFIIIAFVGRYPTSVLLSMIIANIIIKYAVALVSCWGVYLVKDDKD